jgi:hypothetical protein
MSHHSDASRHPANKPFLHEHHDAYPHVKTPHGIFQDHQTLSISDLPMESAIPPTTSLSSRAFSGSNFIDFELPKMHLLKSATLCMEIVNNDPLIKCVLPVAFNLIDRFEIYFGSSLVETVLSEALYINHCTNNNIDKRNILEAGTNTDPILFQSSENHAYVDANGTEVRELYIRLYSLLSNSNIFLPGIIEDIRVRVHFSAYSKWSLTGGVFPTPTTEPSLQKVEMRLQHVVLANHNYQKLLNLYRNNQVNIKYLDHRFQSYSISATKDVSINHVLSSINGLISHMYILVRTQNASGGARTIFKKINRLYLTDSSGSSIHNGIVYTDAYLRGPYSADHFEHSNFFSKVPVYPIAFSNDVFTTVNTANCLGARHFTSMEQLYIVPGETGNFEVLVLTYAHAQLHIKNGQVSVSRS